MDTKVVLFQEVAEPKNGGFVKRAHHATVQPRKFAVQRDIMQGFLHRRVRQSKPLLQEVDAQHGLNGKRRASAFGRCATECKRLNQANQFGPRHHRFISSRNTRLRVLLVTSLNPVVVRLICFINVVSPNQPSAHWVLQTIPKSLGAIKKPPGFVANWRLVNLLAQRRSG